MRSENIVNSDLHAREFLEKLRATGVSEAFVAAAIASIFEAFRSVPPEALPSVLQAIREAAERQAETEQALENAAAQLEMLEAGQARLFSQLHHMSATLEQAKNSLTAASLLLYSALSGHGESVPET